MRRYSAAVDCDCKVKHLTEKRYAMTERKQINAADLEIGISRALTGIQQRISMLIDECRRLSEENAKLMEQQKSSETKKPAK